MKYNEIEGNLITLALEGMFDVIAHGCNCFNTQKSGIAKDMAYHFNTDKYDLEFTKYKGDINKLGQIDYNPYFKSGHTLHVVNCYTQYSYGKDRVQLDYDALTLCMRKINHQFKGQHIGLPLIGCGLAGGIFDSTELLKIKDNNEIEKFINTNFKYVKTILQQELKDCDVTIVKFKP